LDRIDGLEVPRGLRIPTVSSITCRRLERNIEPASEWFDGLPAATGGARMDAMERSGLEAVGERRSLIGGRQQLAER
jgi:hypothetical protein